MIHFNIFIWQLTRSKRKTNGTYSHCIEGTPCFFYTISPVSSCRIKSRSKRLEHTPFDLFLRAISWSLFMLYLFILIKQQFKKLIKCYFKDLLIFFNLLRVWICEFKWQNFFVLIIYNFIALFYTFFDILPDFGNICIIRVENRDKGDKICFKCNSISPTIFSFVSLFLFLPVCVLVSFSFNYFSFILYFIVLNLFFI